MSFLSVFPVYFIFICKYVLKKYINKYNFCQGKDYLAHVRPDRAGSGAGSSPNRAQGCPLQRGAPRDHGEPPPLSQRNRIPLAFTPKIRNAGGGGIPHLPSPVGLRSSVAAPHPPATPCQGSCPVWGTEVALTSRHRLFLEGGGHRGVAPSASTCKEGRER